MTPKRLIIGQKLGHMPATEINFALDGIDRLERLIGHAPGCPQELTSAESCSLVALAKNTSSEAFWERGIAGVTRGGLVLPTLDTSATGGTFGKGNVFSMPTVEIDTPDATLHASKWCVPLQPIGPGRTGLVAVMGLICLRVDVTDTTHKFAALQDGDRQYLKSAASGFAIWQFATEDSSGAPTTGKQWCIILVGGGSSSSSTDVDIKIALIDDDIDGVTEDAPPDVMEDLDVPLTEDEVAAGYTIVFQNPTPAVDTNYDANHVDSLDLRAFQRRKASHKFYKTQSFKGTSQSIPAANKIQLEAGSSTVNGFFVDDTITLNSGSASGETRTILAYDGATLTATVDSAWSVTPSAASDYTITSVKDSELATTIIDDPGHDPPRKIVRYSTIEVWHDARGLTLGKYGLADYVRVYDYDENGAWPPAGMTLDDPLFKKPERWYVLKGPDGVYVKIEKLCEDLPPPPLPEA
jgi:hypothetical protein